ncbi:hypothetical protein Tco_1229157 [Tanacetum coccineum]
MKIVTNSDLESKLTNLLDQSSVLNVPPQPSSDAPGPSQAPTTSEIRCLLVTNTDLRQLMKRPKEETTFGQMTFLCVLLLTLYLIIISMSNIVNSDGYKPYQHHENVIKISFACVFVACLLAKVATYVGEYGDMLLTWARGLGFVSCGLAISAANAIMWEEELALDSASEDMQAHATEVVKMVKAASWCLQADITERPSMIYESMIKVLEGAMNPMIVG